MAVKYNENYTTPMSLPSNPTTAPNNTLATVSLLAGIGGWGVVVSSFILGVITFGAGALCVFFAPIPWLFAVITGHLAHDAIKKSGEGGRGQATVGIIMGYAGMAFLVIGYFLCGIYVNYITDGELY